MTNGAFVTTAPWPMFRRVRENDAYFFLDNGVGAAILVPKRAFDPVGVVRFGALARAGVAAGTGSRTPDGAGARTPLETAGTLVAGDAARPVTGPEPDGAVVHGSFTMTIGEYGRASAWLMRRAASSWVVGLGLVAFGIVQVVAWGAAQDPITAAVAVGTVGMGLALATGLVARPILWLAGRRRRDLFTQPTTIVATAAGIRIDVAALRQRPCLGLVRADSRQPRAPVPGSRRRPDGGCAAPRLRAARTCSASWSSRRPPAPDRRRRSRGASDARRPVHAPPTNGVERPARSRGRLPADG